MNYQKTRKQPNHKCADMSPILGRPEWSKEKLLDMNQKALDALERHHSDRMARAKWQNDLMDIQGARRNATVDA